MTMDASLSLDPPHGSGPAVPVVAWGTSEAAWRDQQATIRDLILNHKARRVLEVGAGANPLFPEAFLREHGITYTALDISGDELAKAPDCYTKVVGDICDPALRIAAGQDFIFSRMVAEHVRSGEAFHRNVHRLLAPGGRAFHFFPTLWALPYVANRLMPERLAEGLLHRLQGGREKHGQHAKFPAYYSWCRGPTQAQMQRLCGLGYEIERYHGFFGHGDYYRRLPPLLRAHEALRGWLLRHPQAGLTSFAQVLLRRVG